MSLIAGAQLLRGLPPTNFMPHLVRLHLMAHPRPIQFRSLRRHFPRLSPPLLPDHPQHQQNRRHHADHAPNRNSHNRTRLQPPSSTSRRTTRCRRLNRRRLSRGHAPRRSGRGLVDGPKNIPAPRQRKQARRVAATRRIRVPVVVVAAHLAVGILAPDYAGSVSRGLRFSLPVSSSRRRVFGD